MEDKLQESLDLGRKALHDMQKDYIQDQMDNIGREIGHSLPKDIFIIAHIDGGKTTVTDRRIHNLHEAEKPVLLIATPEEYPISEIGSKQLTITASPIIFADNINKPKNRKQRRAELKKQKNRKR